MSEIILYLHARMRGLPISAEPNANLIITKHPSQDYDHGPYASRLTVPLREDVWEANVDEEWNVAGAEPLTHCDGW
jgi:hypothetical protein